MHAKPAGDIQNLLSPDDIALRLRIADKAALLRQLAERVASRLDLDPEEILGAILRREALGSTGVGEGIAIPHARLDTLKRPAGALAVLAQPLDFDAIDGEPVDIVFLLLLPAVSQGEQLNVLSRVARALREPELRDGLRRARNADAAYRILTSATGRAADAAAKAPR
jgi:PTS system nitrogen regulatory IIA component